MNILVILPASSEIPEALVRMAHLKGHVLTRAEVHPADVSAFDLVIVNPSASVALAESQRNVALPDDLLFEIFSRLDVINLIIASWVCAQWRGVAKDDQLWTIPGRPGFNALKPGHPFVREIEAGAKTTPRDIYINHPTARLSGPSTLRKGGAVTPLTFAPEDPAHHSYSYASRAYSEAGDEQEVLAHPLIRRLPPTSTTVPGSFPNGWLSASLFRRLGRDGVLLIAWVYTDPSAKPVRRLVADGVIYTGCESVHPLAQAGGERKCSIANWHRDTTPFVSYFDRKTIIVKTDDRNTILMAAQLYYQNRLIQGLIAEGILTFEMMRTWGRRKTLEVIRICERLPEALRLVKTAVGSKNNGFQNSMLPLSHIAAWGEEKTQMVIETYLATKKIRDEMHEGVEYEVHQYWLPRIAKWGRERTLMVEELYATNSTVRRWVDRHRYGVYFSLETIGEWGKENTLKIVEVISDSKEAEHLFRNGALKANTILAWGKKFIQKIIQKERSKLYLGNENREESDDEHNARKRIEKWNDWNWPGCDTGVVYTAYQDPFVAKAMQTDKLAFDEVLTWERLAVGATAKMLAVCRENKAIPQLIRDEKITREEIAQWDQPTILKVADLFAEESVCQLFAHVRGVKEKMVAWEREDLLAVARCCYEKVWVCKQVVSGKLSLEELKLRARAILAKPMDKSARVAVGAVTSVASLLTAFGLPLQQQYLSQVKSKLDPSPT